MMWLSSFLLFVAFSSALGQLDGLSDEFEQCANPIKELDLETLEKESGDVQMEAICPAILEAFGCLDGIFTRELSMSLEDFVTLTEGLIDEDVTKMLKVAVNTKSMLTDLCTEGTQLNIDVKEDMQCFESIDEEEAVDECKNKAAIYDVFTDISNEIEEADSDFKSNAACQESAFMVACISYLVHDKCGQRAFNTINTIIKRTTIFSNAVCSKEKLEEMKTEVIDSLNMPEAEKTIFKMALDLKRRRK